MKNWLRSLALTVALMPFAACHEIGHVGDTTTIPGSTTPSTLVGEVRDVNTSARQVEVFTDAGRMYRVDYDNRTRVIFDNKEYSPSNLESGDYVDMRVYQENSGRLYSNEIRVRQAAQDRQTNSQTGRPARVILGDVLSHDTRKNEFELQADGGRKWTFAYSSQTSQWRNRGTATRPFNVNPGDHVAVTPRRDGQGKIWADIIDLRQNRQERTGGAISGLERFEGTVEYLDKSRGLIEVRSQQNRLLYVTLPFSPKPGVADRFNRLRVGDAVRVEGRFLNSDRLELENIL